MGRVISVHPAPLRIYTRARSEGALIVGATIIRSRWVSPGKKTIFVFAGLLFVFIYLGLFRAVQALVLKRVVVHGRI